MSLLGGDSEGDRGCGQIMWGRADPYEEIAFYFRNHGGPLKNFKQVRETWIYILKSLLLLYDRWIEGDILVV